MTTRDTLEYILEAIEENKRTEERLVALFNRVYEDHLEKRATQNSLKPIQLYVDRNGVVQIREVEK